MLLPEGRMILIFQYVRLNIEIKVQSMALALVLLLILSLKMKFKNFTTKLKSWRICKMQLFETMKLEDGCIYREFII